jgi:hypothetical protein
MTRSSSAIVCTALLVSALAGCRNALRPGDTFTATATVDRGVEAGCLVLRAANAVYDPANIPAAFQVPGLQVRFTARYTPRATTCMQGDVIQVLSIERTGP